MDRVAVAMLPDNGTARSFSMHAHSGFYGEKGHFCGYFMNFSFIYIILLYEKPSYQIYSLLYYFTDVIWFIYN